MRETNILKFISAHEVSVAITLDGGATRPLPRDGGVEELHGDPTVGPRPKVWTRGQKWKKQYQRWFAGEA